MRHCINSLLGGGEDVEILLINDGSTDETTKIVEEYRKQYPDNIRVFHQSNGGHGAAISTGILHAVSFYIKIVDSDDWVDPDAYAYVMATLRRLTGQGLPDMVVTNFVYEKNGKKIKKVMRYINALPTGRVFGWRDIGRFRKGQYMLMHSIIYRTNLLRCSGLELPRHTFYVDNLYAYIPLKDVLTMYYLDIDFYRYFIGREDQSVKEETMIRHIDQHLRVNRMMLVVLDLNEISEKRQKEYLFNYLEIVTMISSVLLLRSGTTENAQKKKELWEYIRSYNKRLYNKLRWGFMGQIVNLPDSIGRSISVSAYKITQKVFGFN
jgi:glycosyltransferase involved in cell wall biosynthesis